LPIVAIGERASETARRLTEATPVLAVTPADPPQSTNGEVRNLPK
jgi:hypothetical protein